MGYSEEIQRLRVKLADAVKAGFIDDSSRGTYEQTLLQIINEAERQRATCLKRSESLRMQAATAEGQAAAFSMISSIVNNIVAAMVRKTEDANEEEERQDREREEAKAQAEAEAQKTTKKTTTRRKKRAAKSSE